MGATIELESCSHPAHTRTHKMRTRVAIPVHSGATLIQARHKHNYIGYKSIRRSPQGICEVEITPEETPNLSSS